MRLLVLALVVAAGPGAAAELASTPTAPAPAVPRPGSSPPLAPLCDRADVHWADAVSSPDARRLTELPPGDTILAVYRERGDGCIDPVIVRYGDGRRAPPAAAPEPLRPKARTWR